MSKNKHFKNAGELDGETRMAAYGLLHITLVMYLLSILYNL